MARFSPELVPSPYKHNNKRFCKTERSKCSLTVSVLKRVLRPTRKSVSLRISSKLFMPQRRAASASAEVVGVFSQLLNEAALPERWLEVDSFVALVAQLNPRLFLGKHSGWSREKLEQLQRDWLLHFLGNGLAGLRLVEVGLDQSGLFKAFRFSQTGLAMLNVPPFEQSQSRQPASGKWLLVQPNFEMVLYSPLDNAPLLYRLDSFADQTAISNVAVYRLTSQSVERAVNQKITAGQIVETWS